MIRFGRWFRRWTARLLVLVWAVGVVGVASGRAEAPIVFPGEVARALAGPFVPDAQGAIGRNRSGYFHARFQFGAHTVADVAASARDATAAEAFVRALEYAFARQEADGGFALVVPAALAGQKQATAADLASATAFFAASAGSGWENLRRSAWFEGTPGLAAPRARLDALAPGMAAMRGFLAQRVDLLRGADAAAPNRLIIDALAFATLGRITANAEAGAQADAFLAEALAQQHADGYFIEGGGYDSSYNAVACAYGYRLLLLDPTRTELRAALRRAIAWQATRVDARGEVITTGNTRTGAGGESFLGKPKQVNVSEVMQAFALAEVAGESGYEALARRVFGYYSSLRGYGAWAAEQAWEGAARGPADDPDGDGLPNLLEFFFASDPVAADGAAAGLRIVAPGDGLADPVRLRFRRNLRLDTATYGLERSVDLVNWTAATATETVEPGEGDENAVVVRAEIAAGGAGARFFRLRVTE